MLFKSRNEKSRLWIYLQAAENEVIVGLVSSRGDIVKAVSSIAGLVFLFIWFFYFILDPLPCCWWNVSVWVDIPPDFKIISEFQALATKKLDRRLDSLHLSSASPFPFFSIWSTNQGAGTGGLSERENIQGESEAACVHLSACVCIFGVRTRARWRLSSGHFPVPWGSLYTAVNGRL